MRRVLASQQARLEVIVIDDGSTDGTSAIVAAAFAQDPRVQLLTLANGGKAAALKIAGAGAKALAFLFRLVLLHMPLQTGDHAIGQPFQADGHVGERPLELLSRPAALGEVR